MGKKRRTGKSKRPEESEDGGEVQQPPSSSAGVQDLDAMKYAQMVDLLSRETRVGLKDCKYLAPTAVQKKVLPHALAGKDVLCAAKTGSGKTLAFVIPILEKLHAEKWSPRTDGIGALVLTPTRELALQIFSELRSVGKKHRLSIGLLIGGSGKKALQEEKARAGQLNILIATPGRLLQHMDETPYFDCGSLKVLVLDEADRILDMGFRASLDAIIENLPAGGDANQPDSRQTLLFSATQTKSVGDLARLSLSDPEYISIHADAVVPTPVKLQQAFVECPCSQKMSVLWGFIKTHLRAKVLVFFSTCKQARFVSEAFSKLRPGVPLRCLHGHMKQMKRVAVYEYFSRTKEIVLFATDVASRGLDFPDVDWVIQFDCPDDIPTYIHRVGRTARYLSGGRSLMLLLPNEKQGMVAKLEEKKIPIKEIKINPQKHQDITQGMVALLAKWPDLKDFAQSGLTSYIKSVYLSPSKDIFDVNKMDLRELAHSYGLANPPKLRFLKKKAGKPRGDLAKAKEKEEEEEERSDEGDDHSDQELGDANGDAMASSESESEEEDMLVVKRTIENEPDDDDDQIQLTRSKKGTRTVFYDEDSEEEAEEEEENADERVRARMDAVRQALREGDVEDKRRVKERQREAKLLKKRKRREGEQGNQETGAPTLGHRSLRPIQAEQSESEGDASADSRDNYSSSDEDEPRESHKMPTNLEEQEALALKLLS